MAFVTDLIVHYQMMIDGEKVDPVFKAKERVSLNGGRRLSKKAIAQLATKISNLHQRQG